VHKVVVWDARVSWKELLVIVGAWIAEAFLASETIAVIAWAAAVAFGDFEAFPNGLGVATCACVWQWVTVGIESHGGVSTAISERANAAKWSQAHFLKWSQTASNVVTSSNRWHGSWGSSNWSSWEGRASAHELLLLLLHHHWVHLSLSLVAWCLGCLFNVGQQLCKVMGFSLQVILHLVKLLNLFLFHFIDFVELLHKTLNVTLEFLQKLVGIDGKNKSKQANANN
jgi:hypothetical protein